MKKGFSYTVTSVKERKESRLLSYAKIFNIQPSDPWEYPLGEYDSGDKWLHPFDVSSLEGEEKREADKRISVETVIGANISFQNNVLCVFSSIVAAKGLEWLQNNVFARQMVAYHNMLGSHELFRETFPDGRIRLHDDTKDSMVTTRMLVLLNCLKFSMYCEKVTDVIEEVCRYVVKDPYTNSKKYKDGSNLLAQFAFCLKPCDSIGYSEINGMPVNPFKYRSKRNDMNVFIAKTRAVKEARKALIDLGLIKTVAYFDDVMVSGDGARIGEMNVMQMLEAMNGYGRSDTGRTHDEALTGWKELDPEPPIAPEFIQILKTQWKGLFTRLLKEDRVMSYANWLASIPTANTTRSAGGPKAKFKVRTRKGIVTGKHISGS